MFIDVFMGVVAVFLLIPVLVLLTQVLCAILLPRKSAAETVAEPSFAILIPAHNESVGIVDTLLSIIPQLKKSDQLLVVADNCADDTAQIARAHGAEVIERHDHTRRGKGFALDFGVQHLSKTPHDILIIIDADCIVEAQSLKKLAIHSLQHHRPVQALYLMQNKTGAGLKAKVAEFAWCVKNWVRPLGFLNLGCFLSLGGSLNTGLPCQLMGTGMAFPWQMIIKTDLANGNIVEDMKLGIDLASEGQAPLFFPEAKVTSFFPTTSEGQKGQSKRWEHGHLAMILSEVPRLLGKALCKRNFSIAAMALDLSVPPLALLVGLLLSYTLLTGILMMFFEMAHFAFSVSIVSCILLVLAVLMAWFGWGRAIISFTSLLYVPVYMLLKIPNYLGFFVKRQSTWNKTKREHK